MDIEHIRTSPLRLVRLGTRDAEVEQRPDGSLIYRLTEALGAYPERLTDVLAHWAKVKPEAVFLSQRRADGHLQTLTYGQMMEAAERIGTALLARNLSVDRPVMIWSENDIEQAMLFFAALHVGVPYVPVSPSYALLAQEFSRLQGLIDLMNPGMIFVSDADRFAKALLGTTSTAEIVSVSGAVEGLTLTPFDRLRQDHAPQAVAAAHEAITPDSIAKFLFTSGTTGTPKAVIFSQRMLTSQRQQVAQTFAFSQDEPVEMVDWLPWHHTFGGTHNLGLVLYSGGSMRIDEGRPMPGMFEASIRNLKEMSPNFYTNTPVALEMLLAALRDDEALRAHFYKRMRMIYYGGAAFPLHIWYGLDEMSIQTTGARTLITSGLGCTEVGPTPSSANWDPEWTSIVGLPVPGMELKVAPVADKLELRFRGPCVTPGYWKNPELTAAAFDEEGFYRSGDAVQLLDPDHPERGLRYDGRISENFKVANGTWVHVGALRNEIVAEMAPLITDAVMTAPNRPTLGAILFPNLPACRKAFGLGADLSDTEVLAHPPLLAEIRSKMAGLAARATGASRRITRFVITPEPALLDTGELTDKRVISQKMVLSRRAALVDSLYLDPPPVEVHQIEPTGAMT